MSGSDYSGGEDRGGRDIAAAEYVLGLLDGTEREAMTREIARDPALAAEVVYWESHFSAFNADYQAATPPTGMLARVEARLFTAKAQPARWYDSLAFWRGATGLALAAALFGIGLHLLQPTPVVPPATSNLVTAMQPVESDLAVVALYDAESGTLRLNASGSPAGRGNDYELWFIAEGEAPISMGVIDIGVSDQLTIAEVLRPRFGPGVTLAVTRETEGGSPDGTPQGAIVSAGVVTLI